MGQTLRYHLSKILLFAALLLGISVQAGYSQSAGDAAFAGFNSDGPGDGFSVVLFTSYSAGERVHFTSEEWDGSAFSGSGGSITWEAPSGGTSPGTVLVFNDVEDVPSVNIGTITDDTNMNLSGSGDVIYVFLGPDKDTADTFLGAIATAAEIYSNDGANPETDGTLEGTGLTSGSTAILLPENIDVAEYTGDRSGNTPAGYRSDLNDIASNWQEENGTGDQSGLVLPFDNTSLSIVSPPTIAFPSSTASGDEGNSINLTVELVQANSVDVNVDVVFLASSSSAVSGDINNFSSQTVSFTGASTGATKDVTITLTDDSDFEGSEKAVFQLQNNTTGSVINPSELTLTITDGDTPDIVVNEIHADPSDTGTDGDADKNGSPGGNDDEFVEFVNNSGSDIDISGWKFYDDAKNTPTLRHTFPDGTVVPAGGAVVLFADDGIQPRGYFGGAIVQSSNESAELSLNNGGDDIELEDSDGNSIILLSYPSAGNNQSIVRTGDTSSGAFIDHSGASNSGGALFSPGTKIDGTAFGSKYAIGIRGTTGWRMISSPVQSATFNDFFTDFWIQGVTGSDDPGGTTTLYSWTEAGGGSFNAPSNISDNLTAGQGYIVYVYEDDEFNTKGIQGGFPKIINTNNAENNSPVSVGVTANDADGSSSIDGNEGWNLLGNPYGTDISVDALFTALEAASMAVNTNIYVWDNDASGGADYVELSKGDNERLAPFQAFWVRYTEAGSDEISLKKDDLVSNVGTEFYKNSTEKPISFNIKLHGENDYHDTYVVEFTEKGTSDLDRYDGYHLFSLDPNSINLFSKLSNNRLRKNVLPRKLDSKIEIPLLFDANGRNDLAFRWNNLKDLPNDWEVMLIDKEADREINLRRTEEYKFTTLNSQEGQSQSTGENDLLNKGRENDEEPRFVLSVNPNVVTGQTDLPSSVKLNPNYPNPFNPQTTIPYELTQDSEVKLTVWNMIGQKVATLVDGTAEAGTHEETWNASNMPSGIYIARFEVNEKVFTRKMTLIK